MSQRISNFLNGSTVSLHSGRYLLALCNVSSPHGERIARLSEKINTIHANMETSKQSRMEMLEGKLNGIEEKLVESHDSSFRKLDQLRDQVGKVQRNFEEDKQIRDQFNEMRDRELKILEQKIVEKFEAEGKALRDTERRLTALIEDKTAMLRSEIAREAGTRAENIDYLKSCMENDLPKLQDAIRSEKADREETTEALTRKVDEEMQKLHSMVINVKKNREETEEALLEMLKDIVNRMKNEIETERKDRESTEETLLGLLEETCTKLTSVTHQV